MPATPRSTLNRDPVADARRVCQGNPAPRVLGRRQQLFGVRWFSFAVKRCSLCRRFMSRRLADFMLRIGGGGGQFRDPRPTNRSVATGRFGPIDDHGDTALTVSMHQVGLASEAIHPRHDDGVMYRREE